jgi:hypothetical protein
LNEIAFEPLAIIGTKRAISNRTDKYTGLVFFKIIWDSGVI